MKALILLGTLKKTGLSNTAVLSDFFKQKLEKQQVECEIIHLVNERILPGTYTDMGEGDAWPAILDKLMAAQIIIFATPVWWGGHSSEIQKVIERLDHVHDGILAGEPSKLAGRAAGIIITGDSDGAQHIIGNISNFVNAIGLVLPPYASLSVLWKGQKKEAATTRGELMQYYEAEYSKTADTMITQLLKYAH